MIHNRAFNTYLWWIKPTNAHKFMKIYYKHITSSYIFLPLMWLSSGGFITKNKYIEMLQSLWTTNFCDVSMYVYNNVILQTENLI
jgi:hypothetical protein